MFPEAIGLPFTVILRSEVSVPHSLPPASREDFVRIDVPGVLGLIREAGRLVSPSWACRLHVENGRGDAFMGGLPCLHNSLSQMKVVGGDGRPSKSQCSHFDGTPIC